MTRKRWSGALIALLLGAACGDDDGPQGKCNDLVAGACSQLDECGVLSNVEQCRRDQSRVMHCAEATAIGQSYEQCVDDIRDRECAAWTAALNQDFALPESCRAAVSTGRPANSNR